MMKKYILTENTKQWLERTLYQIQYIVDIHRYGVAAGELGGWIESERNLSHEGSCVVLDNTHVCDNAHVFGNACVSGNARVDDNTCVCDDACVYGNARVYGYVQVSTFIVISPFHVP